MVSCFEITIIEEKIEAPNYFLFGVEYQIIYNSNTISSEILYASLHFRNFLAGVLKAIEGKVINLQDKNFETGSDMQIGHIFHILVIISPRFTTNTQFKYV